MAESASRRRHRADPPLPHVERDRQGHENLSRTHTLMSMPKPSNTRPGPAAARRARILEHIQTVGGASLAELARDHEVSTITVHRDLEHLSREGLVERFHGGARAISGPR